MHRLIALALFLAGCQVAPPDAPVSFRDLSVPIASTTRFVADRFVGAWWVVADYSPALECGPKERFDAGPRPGTLVHHICPELADPGSHSVAYDSEGVVFDIGPYGRLSADGPPIWVLWVAEDYGTAVLGTPTGSFGRILNRRPAIRPDRLAAAKEVLAFNGYDLSRLKVLAQ